MEGEKPFWVPLESNPEVMNSFIHNVGVPKQWGFSDCYGLDEELLAFSPQPCLAVILLFPYKRINDLRSKQDAGTNIPENPDSNVWFMKQLVGNACGTVAAIHAVANSRTRVSLEKGSTLEKFFENASSGTSEDRGRVLVESSEMANVHKAVATDGQTKAPKPTDKVGHHFICFTHVGGGLYELDGSFRDAAMYHGPTSEQSFLVDAAKLIKKKFIELVPDEVGFSVLTFGPLIQ